MTHTDPTAEPARALLYRYGLLEEVIDSALCLHAQELAAVQREFADQEDGLLSTTSAAVYVRGIRDAADRIDPTCNDEPAAVSAVVAPPTDRTDAPIDWIDGHPQLEAIAAAVWERCGRSDSGACVEDDPRNIAVAALGAVFPEQAGRAAVCICGHTEAQHFEDVCITEITGCDCGDYVEPDTAREAIDRWRAAALKARAEGLTAAADFVRRLPLTRTLVTTASLEAELRRLAVEAHDTGTQQQDAPASRLSGQHADALWDAIAPPGPDRPSYPVQHERVCRVVADIVDEVTAGAGPQQPDTEAPTADRPAVLQEIATTLDQLAETDVIRKRRSLATARRLLAVELRRMADEPAPVAQQPAAEAHSCSNCEGVDPASCLMNPDRQQPAAADGEETRGEPPIVAYSNSQRPGVLLCRQHGEGWMGLTPLTSEDLPDGGICAWNVGDDKCGVDVLAKCERS